MPSKQYGKKIRIAFFPPYDGGWIGGVNYFKNLFYAINKFCSNEIVVVIFLPKKHNPSIISDYLSYVDECHYVSFLSHVNPMGFLNKVENSLLGSSYFLEMMLSKYHIDVISHVQFAGMNKIKVIGWIPDFQHLHLPDLFTKKELKNRNKTFTKLIKKSDAVFFSSHDAMQDFMDFAPAYSNKGTVLQFVSQPEETYFELNDLDKIDLLTKYNLPPNYFYLPNQFWKHKNHMVAFKAIKILINQGKEICLVCTGNLNDYRSPEYIKILQNYVTSNHLQNFIRFLGVVPYKDVYALIKFSSAVVNPSKFEGWSSTVEECKSVGKALIISDINVHLEQAPEANIFSKDDPISLANTLSNFSNDADTFDQRILDERTKSYALNFLSKIKSLCK
jgi:glycosyltransferase involved in cell wall biosynthesis